MNTWFAFYLAALVVLGLFMLEVKRASTARLALTYAGLGLVVTWTIAVPTPLLIMNAQAGMLTP